MGEGGAEREEQPESASTASGRADLSDRSPVPDLPEEREEPRDPDGAAEARTAQVPDLPPEPGEQGDAGDSAGDRQPGDDVPNQQLEQLGERHPDVADAVRQFAEDRDHPTDLSRALSDPARRDGATATLSELADGRLLHGESIEDYRRDHPGSGPLFEPVAPEVNQTAAGESRKAEFARDSAAADPVRGFGAELDAEQVEQVRDYGDRLRDTVTPQVREEVAALAEPYDDASVSVRTKSGDGVLEKVERQAATGQTDYRVGDVTDAVGARITVADTHQLAQVYADAKGRLGTGDGGQILGVENRYVDPNPHNPSYRVISITAATEVDGQRYPYELQLCTRRTSVASDLEHNTCYKPYVPLSDQQRDRVRQMQAEAAALDQEETRS